MWVFHMKIKMLASTLSNSSRSQYGNIYATVKDYE